MQILLRTQVSGAQVQPVDYAVGRSRFNGECAGVCGCAGLGRAGMGVCGAGCGAGWTMTMKSVVNLSKNYALYSYIHY